MLHKCVKQVLRLAIKYRGTTFRDYMDSRGQKGNFSRFLKVYDREGEKCSRCGSVLKGKKIGGRSSVYCAKCQH